MMVNNFIQKNIKMGVFFSILILINMQIVKFIHILKKYFHLKIILKNLPMVDIVRYKGSIFYFHIILEPGGKTNLEITY
jgi:hypothetical protein